MTQKLALASERTGHQSAGSQLKQKCATKWCGNETTKLKFAETKKYLLCHLRNDLRDLPAEFSNYYYFAKVNVVNIGGN